MKGNWEVLKLISGENGLGNRAHSGSEEKVIWYVDENFYTSI